VAGPADARNEAASIRVEIVELANGEHKSSEYLALNPLGKVPTVKDGNFVIYESLAVMAYLDKRYPDTPIFGVSPQDTGTIW
jgi:glutathione S-transferase